jgi:hypothetical protein
LCSRLSCYVNWREDAAAVTDAYRQWSEAPVDEKGGRFLAYLATLDHEESSAGNYALAVGDVERSLYRGQSV